MPSGYARVMSRTTAWVVGTIAIAAAAVLGQAGYSVYQKRVQQKQVAGITLARKTLAELARVADNDRAHNSIGDRRGEPLVLEDLGKHL